MMLKIYEFRNPQTNTVEKLYEFPERCYTYAKPDESQILVSDKPMQWPVKLIHKAYIKQKENHGIMVDVDCDEKFAYPPVDLTSPKVQFNRFLAKITIQLIAPMSIRDESITWWRLIECMDVDDFRLFVENCLEKKVPWSYVKDIVEKYYETNQWCYFINYSELVDLFPCEVISNEMELELFCDKAVQENPKSVEDYRKGKLNSINHLKGQVMKMTKGKADARVVTEILERKLKI